MKIRHTFSALAAAALLGLGSAQVAAADSIKVGTFLAVTGGASFLGDPELKTLQVVRKYWKLTSRMPM